MKAHRRPFLLLLSLTGVLFGSFTLPGHSATLTWNGGVSGDWVNGGAGWTGGSWNNSTPDSAIFSGTTPTSVTINAGGVTVDDLTVSSGTYSFGGTGTLTLSNSSISIASGLTTTLNSALAGTTGLTKTGAGTLIFSGTNKNYSGTTTITGGAIQISGAAAGNLGSTNNGAVTLDGGALHAQLSASSNVNYAISVGTSGGELRNLGSDSQRWQMVSNTISGSNTLTLSFGSNNTRFTMGTTTQSGFTGKWIIDSGSNINRFVDVDGNSTFGGVTGDDAITLINSGSILFRSTRTYGSGYGITLGSGGGNIATGGTQTVTLAAKISGASGNNLRLDLGNSASVLILANTNNSWLGATTLVGSGTLRLGASGVITDTGATLDMGSTTSFDLNGFSETIGGVSGSGTVRNDGSAATLTIGGNNQNATFSGTIGAGASVLNLAKTGSGTQTFSGTISYTGSTTVNSGALELVETGNRSYAGLISGNGTLIKSGGGTLTLSNASNAIGRLQIKGGAVTVTGGLTSNGSGTFAVADFGNASLDINSGSVAVSGSREFVVGLQSTGAVNLSGGSLTVASGVTVGIGSHAGTSFGNSGDGTLAVSSGTATIQGTSSEFIYLARPRIDNLSTGNFSGGINVTGGILASARTFAEGPNTTLGTKTSSITLNGGTLKSLGNNSNWIGTDIDTLTFGSSGATIDTNGFDMTIAKAASGTGGLTKNGGGMLVLAGTNTYSGLTRVNAGTLMVGDGASGSAADSDFEVNDGATLKGSGAIGTVTVNDGGILAPGNSTGIFNTGDLTLEAGATLGIEINGVTLASGYDQLNASGSATLQGLLAVTTGYSPSNGALFFILLADSITGTFSNAPVDGGTYTFGSQQYQISYAGDFASQSFTGGSDVVLMAVPEPAAALIGGTGFLLLLRRRRNLRPS